MPNINLLTGKIRLLKADGVLLSNSLALVDCLVENFEEVFGDEETDANAALAESLEKVRDPLAVITAAVQARIKTAKPKAEVETKGS